MGEAHFRREFQIDVEVGDKNKPIVEWNLPYGSYVVTAKFTAACKPFLPPGDDITFRLTYGNFDDAIACVLSGRDIKTLVLTVAGTVTEIVATGHIKRAPVVRLFCDSTPIPIVVEFLTFTAIRVDAVNTG